MLKFRGTQQIIIIITNLTELKNGCIYSIEGLTASGDFKFSVDILFAQKRLYAAIPKCTRIAKDIPTAQR
jgi:hypothetical protein